MSRRKQAKPRLFKPEPEANMRDHANPNIPFGAMAPYTDAAFVARQTTASTPSTITALPAQTGTPNGCEGGISVLSSPIRGQLETNDSLESEANGTDQSSSWRSETPDERTASSTPSSCATPNSVTDLPDVELSYTVGITEATPYDCQFCDKAFPRLSFLKKHEQIHNDHMPFRCEFCSRFFKHKRSRDRHVKLHTGDKKYRCTQCEAAFSRSDHLKIHRKTHDNQKPFQCIICNRGYNTAAALTSHMQNHKKQCTNASEESIASPTSYRCALCAEYFQEAQSMQNHMLVVHPDHQSSDPTDQTPLPKFNNKLTCVYCTKDCFSTVEQLDTHVQSVHASIVSGELHEPHAATPSPSQMLTPPPLSSTSSNPCYACDYCTMRFSTLHRLQKHYVIVHKNCEVTSNKPLTDLSQQRLMCVQCNIPFQSSIAFTEHYVMTHGNSNSNSNGNGNANGNGSSSLSNASPASEQLKPTDLSKKSISPDRKRTKRTCLSSNESTNASAQYEYTGMLLCNQCDAALPDFEAFRSHLKIHLQQVGTGTSTGNGTAAATGSVHSLLHLNNSTRTDIFHQDGIKFSSNNCICPHCGVNFTDIQAYEQHVVAHFLATDTEYECQNCMKIFAKQDELQKHLLDIHTQHLFRCLLCKDMFDSKVGVQVHFAVKHGSECKLFRCVACLNASSVFRTELEFNLHLRTVHETYTLLSSIHTHPKTLQCMFCHQHLSSELEMQFHLSTHSKQFQCPLCSEVFQIEFLLDKHIEMYHTKSKGLNEEHSGSDRDKPSKKTSYISSPLQIEKAITSPNRTSQKPSSGDNNNIKMQQNSSELNNCDICERNDFGNESELEAHRKLIHHVRNTTKNGSVSLHCAYCNEACKSRTELENHMKNHSQSSGVCGKHKCNICDELCSSAILLAEHKLTHCKVISANCCTQCKASITSEDQFYSHLVQHSSNHSTGNQKIKSQVVLPTACVICRQTLISNVEVRLHSQFHLRNNVQYTDCQCSSCFKMVELQNVVILKGNYICSNCYALPSIRQCTFHCAKCQMTFESVATLEQHSESVHSKLYTCIKCQASFESERDIQTHVNTHLLSEGSCHECHLCRRLFSSSIKLQAHLIEHTFAGCGGFTCYLCSAVFTISQGLQNHILEHGLAARPYDCPHCNLKFFFRAELDNHSFSHLGSSPRTSEANLSFMSPESFYVSLNDATLKADEAAKYYIKNRNKIESHQNTFTCLECAKEFCSGSELHLHKKRCLENINGNHDNDNVSERKESHTIKQENSKDSKKDKHIEMNSPMISPTFKTECYDDNPNYDDHKIEMKHENQP